MRGMHFLQHSLSTNTALNDPPLGEAPGVDAAVRPHRPVGRKQRPNAPSLFHELIVSPTAVFVIIGIWKTLLFLPAVGLVFHWMRRVYGLGSAWLAAAVVCIEPNFAAHIPLPTLDILGVEGTLFGCYACWNYLRHPTDKSLWAHGPVCARWPCCSSTQPWCCRSWRSSTRCSGGSSRPMLDGRRWISNWSAQVLKADPAGDRHDDLLSLGADDVRRQQAAPAGPTRDPGARSRPHDRRSDGPFHLSNRTPAADEVPQPPWPVGLYIGSVLEASAAQRGRPWRLSFGQFSNQAGGITSRRFTLQGPARVSGD